MTVQGLVAVLVRRWAVVLVCMVCVGLSMLWAVSRPGIYSTQVDVIFLAPVATNAGNLLEGSQTSLIYFAGMVESELNQSNREPRLSSAGASLYGTGVRDGHRVTLPNTGGQWTNNFTRPVLSVEVVGPNESGVRAELDAVLHQIDTISAERQSVTTADPAQWIETRLAPAAPAINYVPGYPRRGAAAIGLVGGLLTVVAAVAVDQWSARRARTDHRNGAPAGRVQQLLDRLSVAARRRWWDAHDWHFGPRGGQARHARPRPLPGPAALE